MQISVLPLFFISVRFFFMFLFFVNFHISLSLAVFLLYLFLFIRFVHRVVNNFNKCYVLANLFCRKWKENFVILHYLFTFSDWVERKSLIMMIFIGKYFHCTANESDIYRFFLVFLILPPFLFPILFFIFFNIFFFNSSPKQNNYNIQPKFFCLY